MRSIMVRDKRRLDVRNIKEKASTQTVKARNIALQIVPITREIGEEAIDTLLGNIFENELVMKAMKLRMRMSELIRGFIDQTEVPILTEGLYMCTRQLGHSFFTNYTRGPVNVLKKQFGLFECIQLCTNPDYETADLMQYTAI